MARESTWLQANEMTVGRRLFLSAEMQTQSDEPLNCWVVHNGNPWRKSYFPLQVTKYTMKRRLFSPSMAQIFAYLILTTGLQLFMLE